MQAEALSKGVRGASGWCGSFAAHGGGILPAHAAQNQMSSERLLALQVKSSCWGRPGPWKSAGNGSEKLLQLLLKLLEAEVCSLLVSLDEKMGRIAAAQAHSPTAFSSKCQERMEVGRVDPGPASAGRRRLI